MFKSHRAKGYALAHPQSRTTPASAAMQHGFMAFCLLLGSPALMAQQTPKPEDLVNALNGVFGRHAKERGSHAKGFCVSGHFTPAKEGANFANSPLVNQGTIPVSGRFSIGGGNPKASDKGRSVRGMAVRFHMAKGEELDLVLISAPVFFAATPAQFVAFLKARMPDPQTGKKDKAKIKAFNQANPNVMPHLRYLSETPPPASYATTPYFSTHAFLFETAASKKQPARWILEPVGGFKGLSEVQENEFPNDFLQTEMRERLAKSPAAWDIFLQIPESNDSITDPSAIWPSSRKKIKLGRLVISKLIEKGSDKDCTGLLFDPNRLPAGISATEDPILAIRSPAYGISFSRRMQ